MGTRGWTLSTFMGCCIWILHGLRAATAVPVTTEEPFATGTASPVVLETEGPYSQVSGTAETNTVTANAETTERILAGSPASPSFPPGAEPETLVPGASDYGSTAPTSTNVTKHLNASQGNERAVTAATISAQHPAVTPEVALGVTEATPGAPLGTTPLFVDVKEDVLAAVTREGTQDLDPAVGAVPLPTTPPPAATWVVQPTADSPVGAGVTALQSQGLTTAMGAAEEGRTQPVDIQSEASANSLSPNPGAGVLFTTQQDGAMSETMGITPEPVGETALEAEESALASVPGDAEDAVNGEPSTADSSHLPPESVTMSGTVENPGEPSLLPDQAALGLAGSGDRDGDGQGGPGKSLDTLGSAPVLAGSEAPAVTGDRATLLLGPRIPTDAYGDMNSPALATGEQPPPLAADLSSSTDSSSASGTAYPLLGAGAGTGPAADDGTETPVSPDVGAGPGALMSPSLRVSQPWGTAAGTPQGADEPGAGSNSALGDANPTSSIPDGLAWPTAGVSAQGYEGTGNMAQAGDPGDGSPFEDTQSDMDPSGLNTQQDPANTGELPAGGTGSLANDELSPASALGHGTGSEAASALEPVSLPGSAPPGNAGLESDLSGAEGPGDLPSESSSAPGAAAGPVSVAEPPESPNLGAAQEAPVPPSLEGSQPWGTAAGAPQGAGLPGPNGPDTDLTSEWDAPSSTSSGLAGPPSPALGDQLGTNLGLPGEEGHGAGTTEQVLGGAGSETGFESSLGSAAGSGTAGGMGQLSGSGSLSSPASPGGAVTAPSTSRGDEAGPIPATSPGSDGLSLSSPDSETSPELTPVQETESTGDVAQAGNPESGSPHTETSLSGLNTQQDPANTGELPAGGTGALANDELSPPSALGHGTEAGAAPALGPESPPGSAPPGNAGLESDLTGAEGHGDMPGESPSAPGAVYPPSGDVASPVSVAEPPESPNLGAAQGAPVPPSLEGSQPWGTAAGAPQGAGLPGPNGPDTDLTSEWGVPVSTSSGLAGPPSPALGDELGTNLGLPGEEGHGAGTTDLGGAGSETGFESSLGTAAGSRTAGGMDQLPGAGSLSGPASPGGALAAPSGLDPANPSALGGAGSVPGAPQPSLDAGPGILPATGEGAGEVPGNGVSLGQSQIAAEGEPAGSGAADGEMGAMLQSASSSASMEGSSSPASSSTSMERSSSPGTAGEADNGASLPGAGGSLSTGLEAAGPREPPMSASGIQSGADLGLPDAKLSQVNVVELPEGASVNGASSPDASLGEGTGVITQIASGSLTLSGPASLQGTQPLVPVASDGSGVSDDTATSLAAPLLPGHGLSSGLAPSGDTHSSPGTQSGSRPLVPGARAGLAGDTGGAQTWSLEDEVASGMPAPSEEVSPRAPASPATAPVLPSAPQRENAAEEPSATPGLPAQLSGRESIAGSSAGGRGELGAAALEGSVLLLPACQPGSARAPSRDTDSSLPGEASPVLPRAMAGQGDMALLLPTANAAGAGVETPTRSPLRGGPGLHVLPPTRMAPGSPGSMIPGPGPAGGSSPAALQPFLGGELTTRLANRAPAAGGSSLATAVPDQKGAWGGSPTTMHPAMSFSPATTSPAPPAPLPRGREVLPRPGAAAVTSRASSPVFPAPPAAALTLLPSPTVPAVPLYSYGARENDQEYVERRVDFSSPLFKPETGFPFGKTLRDSLYFTDNGQIIFPSSDNAIFTYPNPPSSGFNGHEEVPMIAVFWDNADFSRGVGTTYYQEFLTLNTEKPPFIRDVEAKIRRYLRSSYSAAWTLKITWEKAPAYGARTDTQRTSTYQAVLTTDGFRSYVLMLYQEGGMGWDYTRLAATNVLIGYTSGDGSYRNDDLTQKPPAAKYRPDQFRGYNTDLRGLWIYKLESRVGVNYRLKCLAWTGRQQEPQMWSQGLPSCPCSLQQGQQDPRFKSSRRGWWAARISMLHSATPNQHGAGVRCLYDSQSQLIEGRQERYWRSSRQASPYRDQELKLYDWCCNQAGSAHLCARYSEKRPKIGCDGYQSPGTAGSSEEAESDSEEQRDEEDE